MGDLTVNLNLEIMKLELRKQQLSLTQKTAEVRIAELMDEKRRVEENFPLYAKEMAEIDAAIENLKGKG